MLRGALNYLLGALLHRDSGRSDATWEAIRAKCIANEVSVNEQITILRQRVEFLVDQMERDEELHQFYKTVYKSN